MNKKKLRILILLIPVLIALVVVYLFWGPATKFPETEKYLYIPTGKANKAYVMQQLQDSAFIRSAGLFDMLATKSGTWSRIRPGKYKIPNGSSLFRLLRKLRNNQQEPVNLVITKLRTRQQLAALVSRKFECDSVTFLNYISSNDSLQQFNVDSTTLLAIAMPETYTYFWSVQPQAILKKLSNHYTKFWTAERQRKAQKLGLTPLQVSVLASIVEEESIRHDEKPLIASVYLNRMRKNMFLGADPTVKYAVGDFSIRRVLLKHITSSAASPYNTYKNKGLPPGPICTPSAITIDAVLNAAETKYLFFCAKPNGNGYHAFAETDTEHLANAKAYQKWLDENMIK